jgi:hypothetical protein
MTTYISRFFIAMVCGSLGGFACQPDHYSVAAARGPNNITFAQRAPNTAPDYLVDCQVDPAGKPANCSKVVLPAEVGK